MKLLITGGSGFIGTNFIDLLLLNKIDNFINVDKQAPLKAEQNKFWVQGDIMDKANLLKIFSDFKPTHVLHLAARTDTASDVLEDYFENTDGTANVVYAIEQTDSVLYSIITSTQYVYKSKEHPLPKSDDEYIPHTTYGISKKITEEIVRKSSMKSAWTIIRPTNVWGPWNMRYPNEFLKIIDKGLYFHPKGSDPVKSYAYVKNVVHQILMMLKAPIESVDKQTYYVGDEPMSSAKWVNLFSKELTGKNTKTFPSSWLKLIAYGGDYLRKIKIPFPLHSVRYNNMLDDYLTPMKKTTDVFGLSHPSTEKNVKETINWIKTEGKPYFEYWKGK